MNKYLKANKTTCTKKNQTKASVFLFCINMTYEFKWIINALHTNEWLCTYKYNPSIHSQFHTIQEVYGAQTQSILTHPFKSIRYKNGYRDV